MKSKMIQAFPDYGGVGMLDRRPCLLSLANMAIIAMKMGNPMRSVNVAELKNQLSKYLTFAKGGEEIVIRDRSLPVAKLVPFEAEDASDEELLLVAAGKMRLPEKPLDLEKLLKLPTGKVHDRAVTQALIEERHESR